MYAWNPRQRWQKKIDCARRWFHRANMAEQYRLSATRLWERVVQKALALEIDPEKYVGLFKVRARVPERRQRRRQRVRRPDIGHQQCETAGDATDRRGWVYLRLSNLRLAPPTAIRSIAELFVFRVKSIISPREGKKRKKNRSCARSHDICHVSNVCFDKRTKMMVLTLVLIFFIYFSPFPSYIPVFC